MVTVRTRYSRLSTERSNPASLDLDRLGAHAIARLMNREDARAVRAVGRVASRIAAAVDLVVGALSRGGRLFFVGAGTSGRLGVLEAAELPPTFDTPRELAQAIMAGGPGCVWASKEGAEDDARDGAYQIQLRRVRAGDAVIGIAASGVTPFVRGALDEAKRRRAARILVTCNRRGVPRGAADVVIAAEVGPEVITGSTRLRAGTATKMILNTLTVAAMVRLGKVYGNLMVDLQVRSDKLAARAKRIVSTLADVDEKGAAKALRAAGGRAKTAIVMLRRRISREAAERLLAGHRGMLRGALES